MSVTATPRAVLIRGARVVSSGAPGPLRGAASADLRVLERADVLVQSGSIAAVAGSIEPPADAKIIEAGGRVLIPAFVDCHTHACWAGDRLDEWDLKRAGAGYLELLKAGGGIMSTVRAVRAASVEALAADLLERLNRALAHGTTTIEVKSGYGLDTETELKMLAAIRAAGERWAGTVVPTACIGHALDPDADDPVTRTIEETLPAVSAAFPGVAIDAYCESGAWSRDDCARLFEAARAAGHPCRVHADQFNDLGLIDDAERLGLRSVDHLEATSPERLAKLAGTEAFGVMLPITGFHTDGRYADARAFVDAGGAVCVASNWNPGSAPSCSVPLAMVLAVRFGGLSPAEALSAATANPAALLGWDDRGRIEPGLRADLVLLEHRDERELCHEVGGNPVRALICGGEVVCGG